MADELPKILDVLFYEPNGAKEKIHVVRDAYDSLQPYNHYFGYLVKSFSSGVMDPSEEKRRKSLWTILNVAIDFPIQRKELLNGVKALKEMIMEDLGLSEQNLPPMHFLTTYPYEMTGQTNIPGTYDGLKAAYSWFADEFAHLPQEINKDKHIGMFVFNAYQGNGELEKIMKNIETDFPMLSNCLWLACKNKDEVLSPTIIGRLNEDLDSRRLLEYNPGNAGAVSSTIAGRVLASPYQKVVIKSVGQRKSDLDTRIFPAFPGGVKNYSYYVKKYTGVLPVVAMNQGIRNALGIVLAQAQLEKHCPSEDPFLIELKKDLQLELEKLKDSITEV